MGVDDPITLPDIVTDGVGGDLLATYWPAALAGLAAGGLVAVYVVRRRRARRNGSARPRRGVLFFVPAGVAVVLAAALAVNAWVGYFPSVESLHRWFSTVGTARAATTEDQGVAYSTTIPAVGRNMPDAPAWVYLPPGYDTSGETRYPLVVALHGAPGSSADWFAGGRLDRVLDVLIREKVLPPVVVVAPDLNGGTPGANREPANLPGGPQIEDFVVTDVVGWADANLRTIADPRHRVISGMSAGGFGALLYGLHHPEVFSGVVSIMPYTRPDAPAITGDPATLAQYSPLRVIKERPQSTGQQFFLGQGDGEKTTEAKQILAALRATGQDATLRVLPGLGHTWAAARAIMPYGLVWNAKRLGWDTAG